MNGSIIETEPAASHAWYIQRSAFLTSNRVDGLGEYQLAIFVNQVLWRVVEFKVVPNGT